MMSFVVLFIALILRHYRFHTRFSSINQWCKAHFMGLVSKQNVSIGMAFVFVSIGANIVFYYLGQALWGAVGVILTMILLMMNFGEVSIRHWIKRYISYCQADDYQNATAMARDAFSHTRVFNQSEGHSHLAAQTDGPVMLHDKVRRAIVEAWLNQLLIVFLGYTILGQYFLIPYLILQWMLTADFRQDEAINDTKNEAYDKPYWIVRLYSYLAFTTVLLTTATLALAGNFNKVLDAFKRSELNASSDLSQHLYQFVDIASQNPEPSEIEQDPANFCKFSLEKRFLDFYDVLFRSVMIWLVTIAIVSLVF